MKILSWNVNGLRAVYKKGFVDWIQKENPDILCLQEIKAHKSDLPNNLVNLPSYYSSFNTAHKKGYSGVLVYSKKKPLRVKRDLGLKRFDIEGRLLMLDFPDISIWNIYIPHGGRQKENMDYKLEVYKRLLLKAKSKINNNFLLIGDFNVAHSEIDLARPRGNKNNTMFTPDERRQLDSLTNFGFSDTFRKFNQNGGNYTWWPYSFDARNRNVGWRIDYVFSAPSITQRVTKSFTQPNVYGSDHCPVGVEIS